MSWTRTCSERGAADPATLRAKALELLARREHSRLELRQKLVQRGFASTDIEPVLDALAAEGLLNERRYAELYACGRADKGYGPLRIRAELSERGIAAGFGARWLDDSVIDWAEVLATAASRKFGAEPAVDLRDLARRGRFLEQRGFPIGLVRRYLDRVRGF